MFKSTILEIEPSVEFFSVPSINGKSDLTIFRRSSQEIFDIIANRFSLIERASIDEAYIDLTNEIEGILNKEHFLLNLKSTLICKEKEPISLSAKQISEMKTEDKKYLFGAYLIEKCRQEIFEKSSFTCSAGISVNKTMAKIICSFNKPNMQTVVFGNLVGKIMQNIPLHKVRGLGGKFGREVSDKLGVELMGDIVERFSLKGLQEKFGYQTGNWLYDLSLGRDDEIVLNRTVSKSIGCSKNFPGNSMLKKNSEVIRWIGLMCEEIEGRLKSEKESNKSKTQSKSMQISGSSIKELENKSIKALKSLMRVDSTGQCDKPVTNIGISCTKLENEQADNVEITKYFNNASQKSCNQSSSGNFSEESQMKLSGFERSYEESFFTTEITQSEHEDEFLISLETECESKEVKKTICNQCQQEVEESAWQVHEDFHFAQAVEIEEMMHEPQNSPKNALKIFNQPPKLTSKRKKQNKR
ncbi:MAG: hypothetical protein MHPSP_000113 [Paramarteilia canceri]